MSTTTKKYSLPKGYSLLDSIFKAKELSKDMLAFISKSMDKFGGTYTASLGFKQKIILTQDPDFINHILRANQRNYQRSKLFTERASQFYGKGILFMNGQSWKRQRKLLQPSFYRQKIGGLFDNIIDPIQQFLATLPTGTNIDIYPLMHQLSFEILVASLFEVNISTAIKRELKDIYLHIENFTYQDVQRPFSKIFYPITGTEKRALEQAKRLRTILLTIIEERKATTTNHNDLLDILINSRYEDTGETMSNDKVVDELIVLMQAGHDTTATTLSWIIYSLVSHPESKQKLKASSVNHTLKNSFKNDYLMAIIHESMRLYTTSWLVERTAIKDDQFGAYSYPAGTMIIGFYYGLHRAENLWENALVFQPERFINNPKLAKSKQFYPFGAGPRMCIGSHFALAEMAFLIHALFEKFDLTATGQKPIMKPMAVLRPDKVLVNISKSKQ